jgi:hypothetical protein
MNLKNITLSFTTILMGAQAFADPIPPSLPRGQNINSLAGACAIGPFEQTGKAGPYNAYCDQLTEAELCLAFIKGHFNTMDGRVHPNRLEQGKVTYCLDTFRNELLRAR